MSALALLLLACAAQAPERSEWELFRGLHASGRLELVTEDPALAAALRARLAPRGGTLPLATRVVGPGEAQDAGAARVLLARRGGPGWDEALALARPWAPGADARDALLVTREDPARRGRPLSVLVGGEDAPLAALCDPEHPPWRGARSAWHAGERTLERPLVPWTEGWPPTEAERAADEHGARRPTFTALEADAWWAPAATAELALPAAEERVRQYGSALRAAGGRARAWLGASGAPGRPVPVRLLDQGSASLALAGTLGRPFDGEDGAYALCGARDDGGAAYALVCALAQAGEPAQLWLRDALGPAAAQSWWGRSLPAWVAHLGAAGLGLSVRELVDPAAAARHSPHRLAPLRAFLLLVLLAEGREGGALWRAGLSADEAQACEARFARALAELGASAAPARAPRGTPPWDGFVLQPAFPARSGGRAFDPRPALAFAREHGAGALALRLYAPLDAPPEGVPRPVAEGLWPGDLEVALVCDEAAALGLARALVLEPLAAPASVRADTVARSFPEDWEDFFERYERVALHAALLAELCACDVYCFGVDLHAAVDVESLAGHPRKREVKRAGWSALLPRLRAAFGGWLVYAAGSPGELAALPFLDALDACALPFLPFLTLAAFVPEDRVSWESLPGQLRWSLEKVGRETEALGRPVLLLPVGFASCERAWESPAVPSGPADARLQAFLLRLLAGALEEVRPAPWLAGLFLPGLGLAPAPEGDLGFGVWGKPAAEELPALFAR